MNIFLNFQEVFFTVLLANAELIHRKITTLHLDYEHLSLVKSEYHRFKVLTMIFLNKPISCYLLRSLWILNWSFPLYYAELQGLEQTKYHGKLRLKMVYE
jgi:hypothetical protein